MMFMPCLLGLSLLHLEDLSAILAMRLGPFPPLRALLVLALGFIAAPLVIAGNLAIHIATRRAYPGLKMTAFAIVTIRAEMHQMGVREDPLSKRLLCAIPWVSPAARWAAYCHLYLAPLWQWRTYPLSGSRLSQPSWRDVVSLRTMLIDDTLAASDAPQLVILGAGFDSRALMPSSKAASKWKRRFEVDFPPTQAAKRAAVEAADLDASATTFVPCDFEHESWLEKLVQAGFDKSQRAVFVWEGVTYYLEPAAVDATVALIKQCAPGSTVVFDFFTQELVEGRLIPLVASVLRRYGEPLKFGLGSEADERSAQTWANVHGLKLRECLKGGKKGARWGGVLSADVQ
ncbi:S-adenosyl-L-methionine-dependent methyltransferase [Pavlovales sp. CCMP2436]|nr:S-adenosyl-L-methionine-dependent methyltransferase [Pavlovales sp. CCMP2436]